MRNRVSWLRLKRKRETKITDMDLGFIVYLYPSKPMLSCSPTYKVLHLMFHLFPDSPGYTLSHIKEIWDKPHNFGHLLRSQFKSLRQGGSQQCCKLANGDLDLIAREGEDSLGLKICSAWGVSIGRGTWSRDGFTEGLTGAPGLPHQLLPLRVCSGSSGFMTTQ